jgi:hypothetical protein
MSGGASPDNTKPKTPEGAHRPRTEVHSIGGNTFEGASASTANVLRDVIAGEYQRLPQTLQRWVDGPGRKNHGRGATLVAQEALRIADKLKTPKHIEEAFRRGSEKMSSAAATLAISFLNSKNEHSS